MVNNTDRYAKWAASHSLIKIGVVFRVTEYYFCCGEKDKTHVVCYDRSFRLHEEDQSRLYEKEERADNAVSVPF